MTLNSIFSATILCLTLTASITHADEQESIPLATAAGETSTDSGEIQQRKTPLLHWSGYVGLRTYQGAEYECAIQGGRLPTVSEFYNDGLLLFAENPQFLDGWELPYWMENDSRTFRDSVPILNTFHFRCDFKKQTCERLQQNWGSYTICILPPDYRKWKSYTPEELAAGLDKQPE